MPRNCIYSDSPSTPLLLCDKRTARVAFSTPSFKNSWLADHRQCRSLGASFCCLAGAQPQVVLTREKGKNEKLGNMLNQRQITWIELPLIESATGPDRSALADVIQQGGHDWVAITSPEAASVFLQGWKDAGSPKVKIAVVGEGSRQVLSAEGAPDLLNIAFTPSKANAKHLSAELPLQSGSKTSILYPASVKARPELQRGLEDRGCQVLRLNTYDTLPVSKLDKKAVEASKKASVVAVASPSAVQAWVQLIGSQKDANVAFACIGSTSSDAAKALGLSRVFSTDSPGLEGFVEAIESALASCQPA